MTGRGVHCGAFRGRGAMIGIAQRPSIDGNTKLRLDLDRHLQGRAATARRQLMCVGLADPDALEIGRFDRASVCHGRNSMRSTYQHASLKVCAQRNDFLRAERQTVPMPGTNHLRAWRKFRHLTLEEVADAIGTTKAVVSQLETGRTTLSQKWLDRIAPVLNTSAGYLLDHDPNDMPTAILDVWAAIPDENRAQALAVLETFKKTGTGG